MPEETVVEQTTQDLSLAEGQPAIHICPDCGCAGTGNYCANCGEEMEPRVLRIRHYVRDVFQELVSLDSKFLHSIPALLIRPGFLVTEFVAGRRKRYLSPLRLHIIVAILLFLAIGYTLRTRMNNQLNSAAKREQIDSALSNIRTENARQRDTTHVPTLAEIKSSSEYIQSRVTEVGPYVLLLCSTPAFALFLALLYRKRKQLYVEHLMFSLYFFSFVYLILIPPVLWLHIYLFPISGVIFCVYLYFALRRYYADRGFKLILRSLTCIFACGFIGFFAFILSYVISWGISVALGDIPSGIHGTINIH